MTDIHRDPTSDEVLSLDLARALVFLPGDDVDVDEDHDIYRSVAALDSDLPLPAVALEDSFEPVYRSIAGPASPPRYRNLPSPAALSPGRSVSRFPVLRCDDGLLFLPPTLVAEVNAELKLACVKTATSAASARGVDSATDGKASATLADLRRPSSLADEEDALLLAGGRWRDGAAMDCVAVTGVGGSGPAAASRPLGEAAACRETRRDPTQALPADEVDMVLSFLVPHPGAVALPRTAGGSQPSDHAPRARAVQTFLRP